MAVTPHTNKKRQREEDDVDSSLELLRKKEVKLLKEQCDLADRFLQTLPIPAKTMDHCQDSKEDTFLSLRISASEMALLRAVVDWGCGAVSIDPSNARVWQILSEAAQNLARCSGWGILPSKLGSKVFGALEKSIRQNENAELLIVLSTIVRVFTTKLGFRPDFNIVVSLIATTCEAISESASEACLDATVQLLQQASIHFTALANAQPAKKLVETVVKKLLKAMANARFKIGSKQTVRLFPLPTLGVAATDATTSVLKSNSQNKNSPSYKGIRCIDNILLKTFFCEEALEQFDQACLHWQNKESNQKAKRMTSYISTLYDALREGAAQGAQPLCEIIPVLAKMYFTAMQKQASSDAKKSRKLRSEMKVCVEMLHITACGSRLPAATMAGAATLRAMIDHNIFEISKVADTEQIHMWFCSMLLDWKESELVAPEHLSSLCAAQVYVIALILEADHRVVHEQLQEVLQLAFRMSRAYANDCAKDLKCKWSTSDLSYLPGTELLLRLADTYTRLRQMPNFLELYTTTMEADSALALQALLGDENVQAGFGSLFVRVPLAQNSQIWNIFSKAIDRNLSVDDDGSPGVDEASQLTTETCIVTLFVWFMRYVTVSEFSSKQLAQLAHSMSHKIETSLKVTGFATSDLLLFDALESLEHLCAAWQFSEQSNMEDEEGVTSIDINQPEVGPTGRSPDALCSLVLRFEDPVNSELEKVSPLLRENANRTLCRLALACLRNGPLSSAHLGEIVRLLLANVEQQSDIIIEHLALLDSSEVFGEVISHTLLLVLQQKKLEPFLRANFYELRFVRQCFIQVLCESLKKHALAATEQKDFVLQCIGALPIDYLREEDARRLLQLVRLNAGETITRPSVLQMCTSLLSQHGALCREDYLKDFVRAIVSHGGRDADSEDQTMLELLQAWSLASLEVGAAEEYAKVVRLALEKPGEGARVMLQSCVKFYEEKISAVGGQQQQSQDQSHPPVILQALKLPFNLSLGFTAVAVDFQATVIRQSFDEATSQLLLAKLESLLKNGRTLLSEEAGFVGAMSRASRKCFQSADIDDKFSKVLCPQRIMQVLLLSHETCGVKETVAGILATANCQKELPALLIELATYMDSNEDVLPLFIYVLPALTRRASDRHNAFDRTVGASVLASLLRHGITIRRTDLLCACIAALRELLVYSPKLWQTVRLQHTRTALNVVAKSLSDAIKNVDTILCKASSELLFSLAKCHGPSLSRKCPALAMTVLCAACNTAVTISKLANLDAKGGLENSSNTLALTWQTLVRVCEEYTQYTTIYRHYAVYWLSSFFSARNGWSSGALLSSKDRDALELMAFCWIDVCTSVEIQQLHALFDEGERESLKQVREKYNRKHKYKGLV